MYYREPQAPPPQKGSNQYFLAFGMILIAALLTAPFLLDIGTVDSHTARIDQCLSQAKQMTQALLLYADDNDDKVPHENWMDVLAIRQKKETTPLSFKCPEVKTGCGYALNAKQIGKKLAQGSLAASTVLVFESTDLSRNAVQDLSDAAYRHAERSSVGFADGHVKAMTKESLRVVNQKPTGLDPRSRRNSFIGVLAKGPHVGLRPPKVIGRIIDNADCVVDPSTHPSPKSQLPPIQQPRYADRQRLCWFE